MPDLTVEVECPRCATINQRREHLAEVVPGCFIAPVEIVTCECGYVLTPDNAPDMVH